MKICQISTVHHLNDNRVFHKQCKSMAKSGHDVALIITHDRNETIDGVRIVALKKRRNRFSRMLLGTFQSLRYAIKERADVYHFHDPELIPAGLFLKLIGKTVFYDVHENTSQQILNKEWLGSVFKRRIVSASIGFWEWLSKRSFDIILVARPDIAEHWNCSKTRIILNSASLETIDNVPSIQTSKTVPIVIYAGGLTRLRGIEQLIQSMEQIGGKAHLWLLGKWSDDEFRKHCEGQAGWKYVSYHGYMGVEQVYGYMKQSDIGIVTFLPAPNHMTTIATKPFEYMACHLPVIMSDFPYWRQVFGDHAVYVNPNSPAQIAEQIEVLLSDNALYQTLRQKGRKLVEDQYSWEAETLKLLEIYRHFGDIS